MSTDIKLMDNSIQVEGDTQIAGKLNVQNALSVTDTYITGTLQAPNAQVKQLSVSESFITGTLQAPNAQVKQLSVSESFKCAGVEIKRVLSGPAIPIPGPVAANKLTLEITNKTLYFRTIDPAGQVLKEMDLIQIVEALQKEVDQLKAELAALKPH